MNIRYLGMSVLLIAIISSVGRLKAEDKNTSVPDELVALRKEPEDEAQKALREEMRDLAKSDDPAAFATLWAI